MCPIRLFRLRALKSNAGVGGRLMNLGGPLPVRVVVSTPDLSWFTMRKPCYRLRV